MARFCNGGSVFGGSYSTISTSTSNSSTDAFVRVWAPVIFYSQTRIMEDRKVESVIKKQFLMNIRFGITVYADCYAGFTAGSLATSTCDNMTWTICKE